MKFLNSKKIFIKYEQIPKDISNQQIIDFLKKNITIEKYIISSDCLEKLKIKTVYVFIENINKIRMIKKKIDFEERKVIYIAEILKSTNKNLIIEKLYNKENIISNIPYKKKELKKDIYEYLISQAKELEPHQIEELLIEKYSELFLKKNNLIISLKKISEHYSKKRNMIKNEYSLAEFNNIPTEIIKWQKKDFKEKALIIHGKSGTGKTNLAMSLLEGKNPLIISNIEKLKEFNQTHKALLFDDCNFDDFQRETIIHLVDNKFPRDFRILYSCMTIPAGLPKIFTTNKEKLFPFEDLKEIQRRILKVRIDKPLFVPININIQINNNQFNNN